VNSSTNPRVLLLRYRCHAGEFLKGAPCQVLKPLSGKIHWSGDCPGIVALGPIAVALAAAGTMGVGAGLIGALAHWGIPSEQVEEYEAAVRRGGILLAVNPRTKADRLRLIESWKSIGGESVHS